MHTLSSHLDTPNITENNKQGGLIDRLVAFILYHFRFKFNAL